jgi:hypothetical protein
LNPIETKRPMTQTISAATRKGVCLSFIGVRQVVYEKGFDPRNHTDRNRAIACLVTRLGPMQSVPPRGSGWVQNQSIAAATHPLPHGGTDCIGPYRAIPYWNTLRKCFIVCRLQPSTGKYLN